MIVFSTMLARRIHNDNVDKNIPFCIMDVVLEIDPIGVCFDFSYLVRRTFFRLI